MRHKPGCKCCRGRYIVFSCRMRNNRLVVFRVGSRNGAEIRTLSATYPTDPDLWSVTFPEGYFCNESNFPSGPISRLFSGKAVLYMTCFKRIGGQLKTYIAKIRQFETETSAEDEEPVDPEQPLLKWVHPIENDFQSIPTYRPDVGTFHVAGDDLCIWSQDNRNITSNIKDSLFFGMADKTGVKVGKATIEMLGSVAAYSNPAATLQQYDALNYTLAPQPVSPTYDGRLATLPSIAGMASPGYGDGLKFPDTSDIQWVGGYTGNNQYGGWFFNRFDNAFTRNLGRCVTPDEYETITKIQPAGIGKLKTDFLIGKHISYAYLQRGHLSIGGGIATFNVTENTELSRVESKAVVGRKTLHYDGATPPAGQPNPLIYATPLGDSMGYTPPFPGFADVSFPVHRSGVATSYMCKPNTLIGEAEIIVGGSAQRIWTEPYLDSGSNLKFKGKYRSIRNYYVNNEFGYTYDPGENLYPQVSVPNSGLGTRVADTGENADGDYCEVIQIRNSAGALVDSRAFLKHNHTSGEPIDTVISFPNKAAVSFTVEHYHQATDLTFSDVSQADTINGLKNHFAAVGTPWSVNNPIVPVNMPLHSSLLSGYRPGQAVDPVLWFSFNVNTNVNTVAIDKVWSEDSLHAPGAYSKDAWDSETDL